MFGTFACPDTCGFAKVAALEIETQVKNSAKDNNESRKGKVNENKLKHEQYQLFITSFNNKEDGRNKFNITFNKYHV
jgi:hypothetical protein